MRVNTRHSILYFPVLPSLFLSFPFLPLYRLPIVIILGNHSLHIINPLRSPKLFCLKHHLLPLLNCLFLSPYRLLSSPLLSSSRFLTLSLPLGPGSMSASSGKGGLEEAESERDVKATAQDMLLSLPCINATNYRAVMDKVESVAALSRMSEAALSPLIGASGAKKLFQFFRQRQF